MSGKPDCIHIVEDDAVLLRNLAAFAASAGYQTASYLCAEDILRVAGTLTPGCIVTDVHLPGMSGLALVDRLRREAPSHRVIVMSGLADTPTVVAAMKCGAVDFLEKPFTSSRFIETVQKALETNAVDRARGAEAAGCVKALQTLSLRQREVLTGILGGKVNKTIAYELGISTRTVEAHRAAMMLKTQATGASALVRMAVLAGL